MKRKKLISVIVLFSLALSSCKQCPKPKPPDEEKKKEEHNPINRTIPDLTSPKEIRPTPILRRLDLNLTKLDGLIEKLQANELKEPFKPTSKALKHAADVISNPASANRSVFDVARNLTFTVETLTNDVRAARPHAVEDFIRDVGDDNRDRAGDTVEAAYNDAILHAAYYAEYVITEVAHIPPTARSPYADAHAADVVRNFAPALVRYLVLAAANDETDPVINAVNELATKVGELKRFFEDWQSRQLGH